MGPDGSSCYQPVPERVSGIKQARKVSAGEDHTLVLAAVARPSLPLQDIIMRADTVGIDTKSVQDEESEFPYFLNDMDIDVSPHSSGNHRKGTSLHNYYHHHHHLYYYYHYYHHHLYYY